MNTPPKPDQIQCLSFGFMASKVLFSEIEFGLFMELAQGQLGLLMSLLMLVENSGRLRLHGHRLLRLDARGRLPGTPR